MTHCTSGKINFSRIFGRSLIGDLKGGTITSDAGGLLLRGTIRVKLLKIGACIVRTARRIVVHISSGYPFFDLLGRAVARLCPTRLLSIRGRQTP